MAVEKGQRRRPFRRLSNNRESPFHDVAIHERRVDFCFKRTEMTNVDEYCVSESSVRMTVVAAKDGARNPMTPNLTGTVEPCFRDHG